MTTKKRTSWGGARHGAGRPKKAKDEKLGAVLVIRCTDEDLAAWTAKAFKASMKLSAWARARLDGAP